MTDRKALTARALIEAQIIKDLRAAHEKTRAELAAAFIDAGEREVATLLDQKLGTVSLKAGAEYWTVADQDAFLEWVCANFADEVEEILTVRPSFTTAVLAKCKRDGGYVDEVTGEIEIPQGLALRKGSPTLEARTDKQAGPAVREWARYHLGELLGIEA